MIYSYLLISFAFLFQSAGAMLTAEDCANMDLQYLWREANDVANKADEALVPSKYAKVCFL